MEGGQTRGVLLTGEQERSGGGTLILLRLVIVFALIVSTAVFTIGAPSEGIVLLLKQLYYGVALYLGFILARLFLKEKGHHVVFRVLQVFADAAFVTLLVYITGLYDSFFNFLYIIVIILGSLELYMSGGFAAGVASSLFYTVSVILQYRGALSPPFAETSLKIPFQEILTHILANDFGFLLGGVLAGYLGNELKKSRMQVAERETDIRVLEDFNRKIIENISSGIVAVDERGRVTFINRPGLDILSIAPEAAVGRPIEDVIPGLDLGRIQNGRGGRNEHSFTRPDGTKIVLGFSLSSLRESRGGPIGKILIFQDLTRVKEMEERVKIADRLAVLGELASGLAHEIRNPLSSIAGSAQVLKEVGGKSEDEKILLEIIEKESRRLNNLIKDFLTFARPELNFRESVDLSSLCEEVVRAVEFSEKKKEGVEVIFRVDERVFARADEEKLKQVVWNLLLNAMEAVPAGAGIVSVLLDSTSEGGRKYARIRIEDNGAGIPEDAMKRIYDPFFTTKDGGTGLGLSVSSRIVQLHGGFIKAENNPSGGAVFSVYLPLEEAAV
ncbi:MAG: PAS domain-containing sensor histidine kinase [Deltaproteobacteria bacterium]|nr:MAG: PAS domain-containing sensor histidine kinase [Deltaproteobacteria bacterium]